MSNQNSHQEETAPSPKMPETLGEIRDYLQPLADSGITRESVEYALDKVEGWTR